MKLYYSRNSPFARIARMALRESGLMSSVSELLAENRAPDNPVLLYSPVGRVPTLIDGKVVITEAKNVVNYLSVLSGLVIMKRESGNDWAAISQEGQILGFVDGIACWVRENRRAEEDRSDFLLHVELDRSLRCLKFLEGEAAANRLPEFPIFRSLALAAGLGLMDLHQFHPEWRNAYQALSTWFEHQEKRSSMRETAPL